jgi:hypothetical protein
VQDLSAYRDAVGPQRRDQAAADREGSDATARRAETGGRPAAIARLQHSAGNQAVVQRLRSYAKVKETKLVGPGKMIKAPSTNFHYTVTKAASPAAAYTDQFHVTFEIGQDAGHPHFYFTDLGSYIPSFENTTQNNSYKARSGGTANFPKLKETAKTYASALLKTADFPEYEGSSIEDIAARKKKAAEEKAAAEALAASEKAKEDADVKTLDVTVTTVKAKDKLDKFVTWLQTRAPNGTATASASGKNEISAEMTFADYAAAKAGLALVDGAKFNEKVVSAEMPDP